jgi:twitching motility protein PilT
MTAPGPQASDWSRRLVDSLVESGRLAAGDGHDALQTAASQGHPVALVLAERHLVEAHDALAQLASISGLAAVDIAVNHPTGDAFQALPEMLARELAAVGYELEGERLTLACAEPVPTDELRQISAFVGKEVGGCVLADPETITRLIDTVYPRLATAAAATNGDSHAETPKMAGAAVGSATAAPAAEFDDTAGYAASPAAASEWDTDFAPSAPVHDPSVFTPMPGSGGSLDVDDLLTYAVANGASDLHLANQLPPAIRVDGSLRPIEGIPRLDNEQIREMVYRILVGQLRERFEADKELDTSHTILGVGRFRVNVFQQRGSIGAVMRAIPHEIPPFESLGLPDVVASLAELRRGLVLLTGPTGSGKSTTLASLVNIINRTKPLHIMTVEDPIEFLHTHNRSIVNQREVGSDTKSFSEALRHVLRQDPDVILIGEMRDTETIATALTAAETGHLVFATLHTQDAPQTIDRIIDVFPPGQQDQIRIQMAGSLEAVVTQQLILAANGQGRIPVSEVMLCTPAIRNLVRSAKTHQIYSLIQTGGAVGMQTMDQGLARAIRAGLISEAIAFDRCHDPNELRDYLRSS